MVSSSSFNVVEEFKNVRGQYCFYLDLQDRRLAKTLSNRIQDLGLRQEVFLTELVTHVVRDGRVARTGGGARCPGARSAVSARTRADAMLELVRANHDTRPCDIRTNIAYQILTIREAILLLNRICDTYFKVANRKVNNNFKAFTKHFIKIEILDRLCRPLFQEFDEWPEISLEPNQKKTKQVEETSDQSSMKMTRKSRPRIKEREEKEKKGGYCEICNVNYTDTAEHQRSLHHLTFVRDHNNFLSLDKLISASADVSSFLDKATPINGERRSLRNMCNGDLDSSHTRSKRSHRSQTPDSPLNGNQSPRRVNGMLDDERRHNTRCSKRSNDRRTSEDRQYYKVVGVSTKLRSSGGFMKRKDSPPPTCNGGSKPLVVKFRKVRRSELSVLSDEAEQFMFPKRASSTSSTSSDDDDKQEVLRKNPPEPPPNLERRRLARPLALKEESSEEDSWPENKKKRKRRIPTVVRRTRPTRAVPLLDIPVKVEPPVGEIIAEASPSPPVEHVNPIREEPVQRCMKWEDGRLKYTPAVEQLEFAFESVPRSEPWFETFKRQDEDKVVTKNVPNYFALYSKSPKLPYEIGQLPPLKPNCCHLSDLVKREEKSGPSRSYGTRGKKKQKIRKRTVASMLALEAHPRKSPREHASTLAIMGSASLLHGRKRHTEDTKSTASEDTISETLSSIKVEPVITDAQQASERLQQFLSEVFEDAAEYDVPDEVMEGEIGVMTSTNVPDVLNLMSECEGCEMIRDEIASSRMTRRGHKFKKKNRTGWPNKKKAVKKSDSRVSSVDNTDEKDETNFDSLSAEPTDELTQDESLSEADEPLSNVRTVVNKRDSNDKSSLDSDLQKSETEDHDKNEKSSMSSDDRPLRLDVKVLLRSEDKAKSEAKTVAEKEEKRRSCSSTSDPDDNDKSKVGRNKRSSIPNVGDWLQPVVRVARVDPNAARKLRSSDKSRANKFR